MKRRIRTLVRAGWHLVEVKSIEEEHVWLTVPTRDTNEYQKLISWCIRNVPDDSWQASLHSAHGTARPGVKRFVFKDEKYAAWFRLMTTAAI